jgi:hypothetical protein
MNHEFTHDYPLCQQPTSLHPGDTYYYFYILTYDFYCSKGYLRHHIFLLHKFWVPSEIHFAAYIEATTYRKKFWVTSDRF